jgi:retinol dehydrogenase-12
MDIIVNNAGVAGLRKAVDEDGMELHFTTNHFGPFLMTNMLMGKGLLHCLSFLQTVLVEKALCNALLFAGLMKKTGQGRIIAVSSLAHKWTKNLDLDNLNSEKKWEPKLLYARTKLANLLFMKELARRLKEAGLEGITANAVNPGGVKTAIFRHARKFFKYMIMASQFFFKVGHMKSVFVEDRLMWVLITFRIL